MDVLNKIGKFFKSVGLFFQRVGHPIEEVFDGIKDITLGVIREVEEAPVGLIYLVLNTSVILQYTAVFLFTNFICGLQMLTNMTDCMKYYMWDVFCSICFLPITILLFVAGLGYPKIYEYESQFWDQLDWLDREIYTYTHIHIVHYSKSVRDKCYNCKRLKMSAFGKLVGEYISDIEDPITNLEIGGIEEMFQGLMGIFKGIMDFFLLLMDFF